MLDYLNKEKVVYEFFMDGENYYTNEKGHFFIRGNPKEITAEHGIHPRLDGKKIRNRIMESISVGNYQKVTKVLEIEDDGINKGKELFRLESDGPNYFYISKKYYNLFKSKKYSFYIPDHWHKYHLLLVLDSGMSLEVDNVIGGVTAFRYGETKNGN